MDSNRRKSGNNPSKTTEEMTVKVVAISLLKLLLSVAAKDERHSDVDDFVKEIEKSGTTKISRTVERVENRNSKRKWLFIVAAVFFFVLLAIYLRRASNSYWWWESDAVRARREAEAAEYIAVEQVDDGGDKDDIDSLASKRKKSEKKKNEMKKEKRFGTAKLGSNL